MRQRAEAVVRELGCATRKFRSPKQALLWYRGQLDSRLRVSIDLTAGGTRRSQEARDQTNATFAAIARCLHFAHWTDPTDADDLAAIRFRLSGEMITWLCAWYEGDGWGDGAYLAKKARLHRDTFRRRCLRTERAFRNRLESDGLLDDAA